jgi:hypothetical protein
MFPERSWAKTPVAATGPSAGIVPVVVNPNLPATKAVEQFRASLACAADTAASANSVIRRGARLFDRMLGFTEPPDGWGRLYDLEVPEVVIEG